MWMHGDFKIENVVVDERSCRLLGVIDWERAAKAGAKVGRQGEEPETAGATTI